MHILAWFIKVLLIIGLGMSLCVALPAKTPAIAQAQTAIQSKTYTFYDLSKIDNTRLTGKNTFAEFYFPLTEQWQIESLDIELNLQFSNLLIKPSSVTAMVNDTPIASMPLDAQTPRPTLWKIKIPSAYLTKKLVTMRLVGDLHLTDNACADEDSPANWLTVSGKSTVQYNYQVSEYIPDLQLFPLPFIQKNAPQMDVINFIVSNAIDTQLFGVYFSMASLMSRYASWRGIDYKITSLDDFLNAPGDAPAIFISMPKDIPLDKLSLPAEITRVDGLWQVNNQRLDEHSGLIMMLAFQNNPVMIISGNHMNGIKNALRSIKNKNMYFLSNNKAFFVAKPTPDALEVPETSQIQTFESLGYKDRVSFGSGENSANYTFRLSPEYTGSDAKLALNYSASPFLSKKKISSITIALNDIPLGGPTLNYALGFKNTYDVVLPASLLKIGTNQLKFTFNLEMPNRYCSKNIISQAWGTIYSDSTLTFTKSTWEKTEDIRYYPELFGAVISVILPDSINIKNFGFMKSLLDFASTFNGMHEVEIITLEQYNKSPNTTDAIIFLTHDSNSQALSRLSQQFEKLVDNLNQTSSIIFKSINANIFNNALNTPENIGFVTLHMDKTQHIQLTIYGYDLNALNLAMKLLINPFKRDTLAGDLAVAFENGTFTSLSTSGINLYVGKELRMNQFSNYMVIGFSLILFVISMLVTRFIVNAKRRRKPDA